MRAKVLAAAVEAILQESDVGAWITVEVKEQSTPKLQQEKAAVGRGRRQVYVKKGDDVRFELTHQVDMDQLTEEAKCDGIFSLDHERCRSLSELQLLLAYKQQPAIERRFEQMKTDFVVAPVYLKETSRIQALLCVYFFVLLVEALLERELRRAMAEKEIEGLPLYPEGSCACSPAHGPQSHRPVRGRTASHTGGGKGTAGGVHYRTDPVATENPALAGDV